MAQTFNSTMPIDVEASASGITQYYKPWRAAVDATCDATAPCVMLQPWGYFYWMAALQGLQDSAVQNIVIALVAAYCVLVLVTRNVRAPAAPSHTAGEPTSAPHTSIYILWRAFPTRLAAAAGPRANPCRALDWRDGHVGAGHGLPRQPQVRLQRRHSDRDGRGHGR